MGISEPLDVYMNTSHFATAATVDGSTVNGILGTSPVEREGIIGYKPTLTCKATDVSSVTPGTAVTAAGKSFLVEEIWQENQAGTGVIKLLLEEIDAAGTPTWTEIDTWTLGTGNDIEFIVSLVVKISITADLNNNITFGVFDTDNAYRATSVIDADEFKASGLTPFATTEITAAGLDLVHDIGESNAGFIDQINGTRTYLQNLIGAAVEVLAYPTHRHDKITQQFLRANGWLAARDGQCENVEGLGHHLTTPYTDENLIKSWDSLPVWSIPVQRYFSSNHIKNLNSKTEIENFLYYTSTNDSSPTSSWLYGSYNSLMEQWKARNTFSPFYMHDELSEDQITWLLELMVDDPDVWVGSFADVMRYARQRHRPSSAEALLWEPQTGHEASDYSNAPWNGKAMAFAFTTDDGREENITEYLDVCDTLGIKFTAFVMDEGEGALSEAQIQTLHDSGVCEIGCHANDASRLIRQECCKLTHQGTSTRIAVKVTDGSPRTITFYKDTS